MLAGEGALGADARARAYQQGRHQLVQRPPILGSAFLFERVGVLTSQTIEHKDLRELFYVNVADKLHCIVAMRAL